MNDVMDTRRIASSLLSNPTARPTVRQLRVLRFLRDEIWSSTNLLGQVMGVKTPQGAHKALLVMEKAKLVSRMPVTILGRQALSVWGITPHGQGMAFDVEAGEVPVTKYFEPNRVSLMTMDHHLDTQRIRLLSEAAGWQDWIPGTRLGKSVPHHKRPDAVVKDPSGVVVAIEIERTIKTTKRYEEIVSNYLQCIKRGDYGYVQYLSPTADFAARLKRMFGHIKSVSVQGQRVALQAQHYQSFRFCAYEQWPS